MLSPLSNLWSSLNPREPDSSPRQYPSALLSKVKQRPLWLSIPAAQQPMKGPGNNIRLMPCTTEAGIGSLSLYRRWSLETWMHTKEDEQAVSMVMLVPFRLKVYEKRLAVMAFAAPAALCTPSRVIEPAAPMHIQSSLSMPTKWPMFWDFRAKLVLSYPSSNKDMYDTSRTCRCTGSMHFASACEISKNLESKRSTPGIPKQPCLQ
mmetsp:Transcript_53828/g.140207  ORF Transcript_53828/g.140207 Transcript_53828/m.140207 type:complete len:206 (+) Transcript_53828:331-948(+)